MKRSLLLIALTLGLIVTLSGCKSAPTEEINRTTEALKSIETADVNAYAAESLKAAKEEMNKAMAEIKVQDEKFALTRDYKPAVAMLKSTNELVEKAKADAVANKAKAKAVAEKLIAGLPKSLKAASDMLKKAPRREGTKADLEEMQNDLKLAEEASAEANSSLAAENYLDAIAKASAAKEKAASIVGQVGSALQKPGRRR